MTFRRYVRWPQTRSYRSVGVQLGYDVNIIDPQRGAVTDSFVAYDPMMSPNQRWIASRHFYALHSEIQISEEYLLYDLNASASENRHDLTPYTTGDLGWAMYPAFPGNAPIDLADIPDANRHEWRSKSFFWAQDSQAVFFADSVGTRVSLVMVLVSSGRPQAYTYPVSDLCAGSLGRGTPLTLTDVSSSSASGGALSILAMFDDSSAACRQLRLTSKDFKPARVEVYAHRKIKKPTGIRVP